MMFFRTFLLVLPAACLLAQVPPSQAPKPASAPSPAQPPSGAVPIPLRIVPPEDTTPPDKVIITVGDRKITYAEYNRIIDSLPENYRAAARGASRKQFAENLVQMLALAQEGRRRKLDQSETYKTMVAYQNENILAGLVFAEIGKSVGTDEAEMKKYYDEHASDFEQAKASHILIRFQGSQVPVRAGQKDLTDAEALAKTQALLKRIKAGEDFAKLAQEESDDTGTGAKGGELGTFGRGQMVPAFDTAVFAMKPGELSDPVKTQFGYHIIKLESKTKVSYEEAKPSLEKKLGPAAQQKALDELVKKTPTSLDPDFFPAGPTVTLQSIDPAKPQAAPAK
jgi:peptidyl-prolyl cis-trans isomerase C